VSQASALGYMRAILDYIPYHFQKTRSSIKCDENLGLYKRFATLTKILGYGP
jgi:hypothetical protein